MGGLPSSAKCSQRLWGACQALGKGPVAVRWHAHSPPPPNRSVPPRTPCSRLHCSGAGGGRAGGEVAGGCAHGGHMGVSRGRCHVGVSRGRSHPRLPAGPSPTGCGEGLAPQKWLLSRSGGWGPGEGAGRSGPGGRGGLSPGLARGRRLFPVVTWASVCASCPRAARLYEDTSLVNEDRLVASI